MFNAMSVGRVLLGLYFLVPGLMKVLDPGRHIAMMEHHGIPAAALLLIVATAANVIGGLLLILNRHVRLTAFGFVVYIILVNVMMHDFWNFTGVEGGHEMQNFVKNMAILAGLLVLASASVKRELKLQGLFKSDNALD